LEDGDVTFSRAKFTVIKTSSFMLLAIMNPSSRGDFNDSDSPVALFLAKMWRYLSKISGTLLDRIDIHIEVTSVLFEKLSEERKWQSSIVIKERVTKERQIQA
jgi:magnesium chelatase family protein